MADPVLTLLRALEDGGKIDKYNRRYVDAVLAERGLTCLELKAQPPVIPYPYNTEYKKMFLSMAEYEFCGITQARILSTAEQHCFECVATRAALGQCEETSRSPRERRFALIITKNINKYPELVGYYRELKRLDAVVDRRITGAIRALLTAADAPPPYSE